MKKLSKFLPALLALVMCVSLLTVNAWAARQEDESEELAPAVAVQESKSEKGEAVLQDAAEFTMTLQKADSDTHADIDSDSNGYFDYQGDDTVVYNIMLQTASGTVDVNALQFKLTVPSELTLAANQASGVTGVVIQGQNISATNGVYQWLKEYNNGDTITATTTPQAIGKLTFTTSTVSVLTNATFAVTDASTHDTSVTAPSNITTTNATATVSIHPTYTITALNLTADSTTHVKTTTTAASSFATIYYNIVDGITGETITAPTLNDYYNFTGWSMTASTTAAPHNWHESDFSGTSTITLNNVTGKYGNVTLTAGYDPDKYTVTYATDTTFTEDNSVSSNKLEAVTGQSNQYYFTIETSGTDFGTAVAPVGKSFSGWTASNAATDSNWTGGTTYTLAQIANKHGDVTLTAYFTNSSYTVTYTNADVAINTTITGMPNTTIYEVDGNSAFTIPTEPSRDGYTFAGWEATSAEGAWTENTVYGTDHTAFPTTVYGNVTLEAQWTPSTNNTVSYLIGYEGGTDPTATTYTTNGAVTLAADPTRTGYTFKDWKVTTAGGNWTEDDTYKGTSGTAGSNTPVSGMYGDVTLTAEWDIDNYNVTFDTATVNSAVASSMSTLPGTTTYTVTALFTAPTANPTVPAYSFAGWQVSGSDLAGWDTNAKYGVGEGFTAFPTTAGSYRGSVIFTATWTAKDYNITYSSSYGTAPSTETYTIDNSSTKTLAAALTDNGRVFNNWSVTTADDENNWTDAQKTTYNAGESIPANVYGNISVTANWTTTSYTATFDVNGGTATGNTSVSYTVDNTVTPPTVTKTGYDFKGWKVTTTGGNWEDADYVYANGEEGHEFPASNGQYGNVVFKAQWDTVSYTMTFLPGASSVTITNAGDDDTKTAQFTVENMSAINAVEATRAGYIFKGWTVTTADTGWNTGDNFVATTVESTTTPAFNTSNVHPSAVTVTAQWEIDGVYKQANFKFYSDKLILFGTTSTATGTYSYNGQAMKRTTQYDAIFGSGYTVYVALGTGEATEAEGKATISFAPAEPSANTSVAYTGDVNGTSGLDVGDYGTAGTIYTTASSYSDSNDLNRLGMDMNNTGESAVVSTSEWNITTAIGTINDLKAIMDAVANSNNVG